ncbi:MAG: alpha/beta hydrolase [Pseudomonadota bacterium]
MLSYSLEGSNESAPVILYLHGLGIGGWCWDPVRAARPEFGALVPDLPGHGKSNDIAWRSIADTAASVASVVDTLPASRPVHVTGHSLGAYVGLVLLTQRPDRFSTALLSGFHVGSLNYAMLLKLAYIANSLIFRVPPLRRRFASIFGDEASAQRFIAGAAAMRPGTIRRAGMQVVDFKAPAGWHALSHPILAVAADGEPHAIRSTPRRLALQLPSVDARVLQGRDHLWPIKEPGLYADLLKTHITTHTQTGRQLQAPTNA